MNTCELCGEPMSEGEEMFMYHGHGGPCPKPPKHEAFQKELAALLNKHSQENGSDTPDFILAQYLNDCLAAWNRNVSGREKWYGRSPRIVGGQLPDPTCPKTD
jgi:hypothetical protein